MNTYFSFLIIIISVLSYVGCRDEDKILKACFWPNELYEPCFGGCAEVSCDNPRNHLRPCYPYCEPGCICEEPYVRDDRTHQCVLPQDCSPTQMGIPIPTKTERRSDKVLPSLTSKQMYSRTGPRGHSRRDDPAEFSDDMLSQASPMQISNSNYKDDVKKPSEVSRMGNYFNIVIAPPPIKALQPRKMLNNAYSSSMKRM